MIKKKNLRLNFLWKSKDEFWRQKFHNSDSVLLLLETFEFLIMKNYFDLVYNNFYLKSN